jgi:predicted enzyme related to lactoylglutathione lyase
LTSIDVARPGSVAWIDLQTPDLAAARDFYAELLGWSYAGGDASQTLDYTRARLRGRDVAGLSGAPKGALQRSAWNVYFATSDADETVRRALAAGGRLLSGPHDVTDAGRMANLSDPSGAVFSIWQSRHHSGAQLVAEPGAMTWHELYTRDAARAVAFFCAVFGLQSESLQIPGRPYWTLHLGSDPIGGVMQLSAEMPREVPPHWNTYFAVADVDAAAKRLTELGGRVFQPPFDTPRGRMSVVADPFGAAFCIIRPQPASE